MCVIATPANICTRRAYSARLSSDRSGRRSVRRLPPAPRKGGDGEDIPPAANNPESVAVTPTIASVVPVRIGPSPPDAALSTTSKSYALLSNPALVVTRQIELLNVIIGFEQGNKYKVTDSNGKDVGFIAEEETSFGGTISRQLLRTRRPFKAIVTDMQGNVVLKVERPMKWLLNSTITITDENDNHIGEVKQVWHPWRRKYDLFLKQKQVAYIDEGFLAWDFQIRAADGSVMAAVNRNFSGFAREIFTDTGAYAIHMDDATHTHDGLSLDVRALLLSCAINIDIDYFSRHSGHGAGFMPIPMFGGYGNSESGNQSNAPVPSNMPDSGAVAGGVGSGVFGSVMGGGSSGAANPGADSAGSMPPPPPPVAPQDGDTNQWGESPWVSDEDSGVSSNVGDIFRGFFDDD
ncbi:Scramblase-domain-containing protein [Fimicolochytrium jonesii]|uniref:Scramblase-domain-containing protein n=1 Tax=Fimicolochytrium jonesii TaxID=1396493 RepID=UPI0022FF19E2|nr:Scramblase-domain-containing protein [Fimicolochytrium jonesii]KAI8822532.1 Scramblase-domain-containing protein [Fimicolochytrium jonesii]